MNVYPTTLEEVVFDVFGIGVMDGDVGVAILPTSAKPLPATPWADGTWSGEPGSARGVLITLAGRLVEDPPAGALQTRERGRAKAWLRFLDGSQVIIREAGSLTVY